MKAHASANQNGVPLDFLPTPGQAHDAPACENLISNLQPGQVVLMDAACDADWIREKIREQGATAVIPSRSNRTTSKEFDADRHKDRNRIERFFGRLKASFRRIATRYEKTARNFMAMIKLTSVELWCRFYANTA